MAARGGAIRIAWWGGSGIRVSHGFCAVAAVLCLPGEGGARESESPVTSLTLDQAVSTALSQNRVLQSATLDVARAQEQLATAKSYRWPSLSVTLLESRLLTAIDFEYKKGAFGDFPGIGPVPAADTKIGTPRGWTTLGLAQLQFPLLQQYRIGLNIRLSEAMTGVSREELRARRQGTVNDVRKTYYGILEAQSAVDSTSETLGLAREIERVVEDRFRAQKALDVDRIESQARLASAAANDRKARDALIQRKEELNSLLGRDLGIEFQAVPVPEPPPFPGDLAAARARALESQPKVVKARLQKNQAELNLRIAKSKFLPDLGFAATYLSPFSVEFLPRHIYSVGLLFQWDVFDAGRRSRDVADKRDQLEQARLAAAQAEDSALLDVGAQYRRFEAERQSLRASELNRTARRDRLRIARDRYEHQVIIAEDLLRAQADFAEAEKEYIKSLAAFWTARADLERAVGEDQ